MSRIWRISNYADLQGLGGLRAGQRWHTRGRRIVYCAPSPAAAILETLAKFEINSLDELPSGYQLLEIEFPDTLPRKRVSLKDLPPSWPEPAQIAVTRSIGDDWLAEAKHAAIEVPSAVAPETWNTLLNPVLVPGTGIKVIGIARHPFDPRLFKLVRS
ncbi:MAG: RES family NAD+ phosphorylase [Burkholderiales bacterium]